MALCGVVLSIPAMVWCGTEMSGPATRRDAVDEHCKAQHCYGLVW